MAPLPGQVNRNVIDSFQWAGTPLLPEARTGEAEWVWEREGEPLWRNTNKGQGRNRRVPFDSRRWSQQGSPISVQWPEVTMQDAEGVISHNVSFPPPAVTNMLLTGSPADHRAPIFIFILCRNSHKHKLEMFGLVFPSVAFAEDYNQLYLLIWFQWFVAVGKTGKGIIFVFQTIVIPVFEWNLYTSLFLDSGNLNTGQVCSRAQEGDITTTQGPEERARANFSPNNCPCHSAVRFLFNVAKIICGSKTRFYACRQ